MSSSISKIRLPVLLTLKPFQILFLNWIILPSLVPSSSHLYWSSIRSSSAFQISPHTRTATITQRLSLSTESPLLFSLYNHNYHNNLPLKMNHHQESKLFTKVSSKRIAALFATTKQNASSSSSSSNHDNKSNSNSNGDGHYNGNGNDSKDYSTKNKARELKRLAKTMEVDVPQVKVLLTRQLPKLKVDSEKAIYVNWLLGNDDDNSNNDRVKDTKKQAGGSGLESRKRSNSNMNGTTSDTTMSSAVESYGKQYDSKKTARSDYGTATTTTKASATDGDKNRDNTNGKKKIKTVRPKKPIPSSNNTPQDPTHSSSSSSKHNSNLHSSSSMKFQDLQLHPSTKKAITTVLEHDYMTDIQSRTYIAAASGTDVLGRARTGTGKTLAFLIPALERILSSKDYNPGKNIGILVVSPTRELATQIGDQAEKLLTFHKKLSCQVMYGGTKMTRDINTLNKCLPTILVATPGRLLDHLENTKLSNGKKFGLDIMRGTPLLILDEADRLLDMGFQREIRKIMTYLPRQERRQTLLFSATVPKELKQIMSENMREDFVEVDCIGGDGSSEFNSEEHTNILVKQTHIILPSLDRYVTSVVEIVKHFMKDKDHKLVVFFPTARLVGFFAEFFNLGLGIDVLEIHSRKSQGYRNQASDTFRKAKTGILFTSDVSARGVDYPDVTGVIQFGLPESRDQYIHRLGRTGRAGKDGKGLLVLSPFESQFISELKDIEVPVDEEIAQMMQSPVEKSITNDLNVVFNRIRSGDATLTISAQQAYQAFIGYYRGQMRRTTIRNNEDLVDVANEYSKLMGLKEIPGLTKRAASKMGLQKLPNVRIVDDAEVRKGNGRRFPVAGRRQR